MSEWWTYDPEDFLLFSPRVYWRLFQLHNDAVWPLQFVAPILGAAILVWIMRPRAWSDRIISAVLVAAWGFVAWTFLWNRYASVNWAAIYAVPVFVAEALLLAWFGVLRNRLHFVANLTVPGLIGLGLFLYALVLHPFVAPLSGRPLQAAEIFGIAPDPTAIATLGLLSMASVHAVTWPLLAVPLAWCAISWATLDAMGAWEGWIPLGALTLAVAAQFRARRAGRASRVP